MTEKKIPHLDILVEGYARREGRIWFASPTTVLIRDSGKWILVDPGANRQLLLQAFARRNLPLEAIDAIFLTHCHLDHLLNIRLFPDKEVYDGYTRNRDDQIEGYADHIPGTRLQVIPTPGHAPEHCSLLFAPGRENVIIAGDVFWWQTGVEQRIDRESLLNLEDPYAQDREALRNSREQILALADYIIPGHGKMFKVQKDKDTKEE